MVLVPTVNLKIMKNIKLFFYILLIISLSTGFNLNAQDSTFKKCNEIYLTTPSINLEGPGLKFKTQMKGDLFFRVGLLNLYIKSNNYPASNVNYPRRETNFGIGFNIGLEKRKMINNTFSFFYGLDFVTEAGYGFCKVENAFIAKEMRTEYKYYINPGIGFGSGVLFNLNNHFFLGAVLNPQILFRYSKDQEYLNLSDDDTEIIEYYNRYTGLSFDFDTESIRILFMYRWDKKNR